MSANDIQVGGSHYKDMGEFQPWDVLRAWLTPEEYKGWMKGNALVYLAREGKKGGIVDIEKAMHTLSKLVEVESPAPVVERSGRQERPKRKYVKKTPTKAHPWGFKKNGEPYKTKPKGWVEQ